MGFNMSVIDQYNDHVLPAHYYVDQVLLRRVDGPPLSLTGNWRVLIFSTDRTQKDTLHAPYTPSQAVIDAILADYQSQVTAFENATGLTPLPPAPEEP